MGDSESLLSSCGYQGASIWSVLNCVDVEDCAIGEETESGKEGGEGREERERERDTCMKNEGRGGRNEERREKERRGE